jgi:23S rRNA (uracil1939-C5)-methyltransferase
VFVERAIPGQRVKVVITQKKPQYLIGRIEEILEESPKAIAPKCPYFATSEIINQKKPSCGGCLWQNLSYEDLEKALDQNARRFFNIDDIEKTY